MQEPFTGWLISIEPAVTVAVDGEADEPDPDEAKPPEPELVVLMARTATHDPTVTADDAAAWTARIVVPPPKVTAVC